MDRKTNYWEIEINHTLWVYLSCPILDSSELPFSVKRAIVAELQTIEQHIKNAVVLRGWIGYTKLVNPHIMVMYLKLGAIPYKIDAIEQKIWFKRELL